MQPHAIPLLPASPAGIAQAAAMIRDGGIVAFPTETVYGLGADATNGSAVARVFEAKGRPSFNPLIVHVPDRAAARVLAIFPEAAEQLAAAFWPGPLTLVLPLRPGSGLSPLVTAGLPSVGLRVPDAPVALALLRAAGRPVAAPSANPSGRISPTRAAHVLEGLAGRVAGVVDGGDCRVGVESTIIGFGPQGPALLRPGGLPAEAVEDLLGHALAVPAADPAAPVAPGQLMSHYAPHARVRLNASDSQAGEVRIGFGPSEPSDRNLSPSGDLVEAAANLFHLLHVADAAAGPRGTIAVAPVPETGLGRAINDRLRRAAAPRR